MKTVRITDFLTKEEIARAVALYQKCLPGTFAHHCEQQIIQPNITRINSSLGQENHPRYLAYAVEAAISFGNRN